MNKGTVLIVDDGGLSSALLASLFPMVDPADVYMPFPKVARLSRECTITEKIDGTNGQIYVYETTPPAAICDRHCLRIVDKHLGVKAGSKTRWLSLGDDNDGFARWVYENGDELARGLGVGRHSGEWWGCGIQRAYGQTEKRFSLFNTGRWYPASPVALMSEGSKAQPAPRCCGVVPVLFSGPFETELVQIALNSLRRHGSEAAPGFMRPEGVVVYHSAANIMFKKTLEKDAAPKGKS